MASSNTTEYFGLCQWQGSDQVLREDFNSDNLKIEEALKDATIIRGTYTGNTTIPTSTSQVAQEIALGFEPSYVMIIPCGHGYPSTSSTVFNVQIAYASKDLPWFDVSAINTSYGYTPMLTITETGFTVTSFLNLSPDVSVSAQQTYNPYSYLAWR